MELQSERARIDAFHAHFNAATSAKAADPGGDDVSPLPKDAAEGKEREPSVCGGCGKDIPMSEALWCGACRCTAYCNNECQRAGWKAGGHKAACKLLARARALPAADPDRSYVVQLKLAGRGALREWAARLERGGQGELAGAHREMAAGLRNRQRVLLALEARQHALLGFEVVPATKRLTPADIALFALRSLLQPAADVPTLNMTRDRPRRPYALWAPGTYASFATMYGAPWGSWDGVYSGVYGNGSGGSAPPPPLAAALGRLLAGAGLAVSGRYVGGGTPAEVRDRPGAGGEDRVNEMVGLYPDIYTSSEEDSDEDEYMGEGGPPPLGGRTGAGGGGGAAAAAGGGGGGRIRALVVGGMHVFGPGAGEGEDPLLTAVAAALRSAAGGGAAVDVAMYGNGGGGGGGRGGRGGRSSSSAAAAAEAAEAALAERLTGGGYDVCVVLGLGSWHDCKPRTPTQPWRDEGPWRDALTGWVRGGGVLVIHGELAAAAVARSYFGLSWTMEGDFYRRTDHVLHPACPLLGRLSSTLPPAYNVKACMLGDVPPQQRVYATPPGATSHSWVPQMAGQSLEAGRCALAAAQVGSGCVAFFGDVNWEPPTMAAVAALAAEMAAGVGRRGAA